MQLSEAKVLIVDDESALREIFAKWLASVGCGEVCTAVDGEDALATLQARPFDLMISDVRMPRMDGITLVRRLAAIKRSIPSVIFVSGFGDVDEREMYGQGVEAFLSKPLRMGELIDVIRRALSDRESLWVAPMEVTPKQTLRLSGDAAALEESGLRIGRGGFSLHSKQPLSLGKLSFECNLAVNQGEMKGQGMVRWRSRVDQRVGIEFAYLEEPSRRQVLEMLAADDPQCFIPG